MDDRRTGGTIRLIRHRLGRRQVDVAAAAGVSQSTVSEIELGGLSAIPLATIRAVVQAVGAEFVIDIRWRGPDLARLRDRDHAEIVEQCVGMVRRLGWEVLVEWSFNHFGERGSIDIVAWHPERQALLIIEVKSRLVDLQDLLSTLGRKARLAPKLLAAERGWRPEVVGRIVVVRDSSSARSVGARHAAIMATALPDGGRRCRRWLADPRGPLDGLWFLSPAARGGATQVPASRRRVRRPRMTAG